MLSLKRILIVVIGCCLVLHAGGRSALADDGKKPAFTEIGAAQIWPAAARYNNLSEIGQGKGIVFSPDTTVPGNRGFYEKLGFAYFDDASWENVIEQIQSRNRGRAEDRIEILIIQAHAANGNGLKLQGGTKPKSTRSYISIGALQERLEGLGVRVCIIASCNVGKLFRPEIYLTIDRKAKDPLFLPATLGIIDASPGYDPATSSVVMARRANNFIEMSSQEDSTSLSERARAALGMTGGSKNGEQPRGSERFLVSYVVAQLLLNDSSLRLITTGYDRKLSEARLSSAKRVALIEQFFAFIEETATRQFQTQSGKN